MGGGWLGVHGGFHLYRCLGCHLCIRSVVGVRMVEVGELPRGHGCRPACGDKEVVVSADFRQYWGSIRPPLSEGRENGRKGDPCACTGDEEVDASGG